MTEQNTTLKIPQPRLRDALERAIPETAQLTHQDLLPLNLDPLATASMIQAVLPGIIELKPQISILLRELDLKPIDQLDLYALALIQSHIDYVSIKSPPDVFYAWMRETELRERLVFDIKALAHRGLLAGIPQSQLRTFKGYKNVARDILTFANLLRASWNTISAKCVVSKAELDRAEVLAEELIRLRGHREHSSRSLEDAALRRQQVFTVLMNAYSQARKAVTFVRWEIGDADRIAPSPYSGKRVSRKPPKPATEAAPPVATASADPFANQ